MRAYGALMAAAGLMLAACQTTEQGATDQQAFKQDQPVNLTATTFYSGVDPNARALRIMVENIEAWSGGRITVDIRSYKDFGGRKDIIEATKKGDVAITLDMATYFDSINDDFDLFLLPYLFRSRDRMFEILDGPIGDRFLRKLEPGGLIGLGYLDAGARSIFSNTGPVRTPQDLSGVKLGTPDHYYYLAIADAMGAEPIMMPYREVRTAIQGGEINGAAVPPYRYYSGSFYLDARFLSLTEHYRAPRILLFSKKIWDRLPAADRDLLRRAARVAVDSQRQLWLERQQEVYADLKAKKVTIVEDVDRTAFIEATRKVRDEWALEFNVIGLMNEILGAQGVASGAGS